MLDAKIYRTKYKDTTTQEQSQAINHKDKRKNAVRDNNWCGVLPARPRFFCLKLNIKNTKFLAIAQVYLVTKCLIVSPFVILSEIILYILAICYLFHCL